LLNVARMRAIVWVGLIGCYAGAPANRDVARVWQGRSNAEIEARWGRPPGVTAGASYAIVKVGVLAVDLRAELDAGATSAFGSLGVGVALN
jgi:hypothetical protein